MLENIQRRTTQLISGLRDLSYEEMLKECGHDTHILIHVDSR